jgi:oligopeptide/dipeptide ABC transporter ATP-binding protein
MDKNILFRTKNLSKSFLRNKLRNNHNNQSGSSDLKGISLDFYKGESIGLTGAYSSGASTLAGILGSEIKPDSGDIYWDDLKLSSLKKEESQQYQNKIKIISPVKLGLSKKMKTASDFIKGNLRQVHQLSAEYEDNMANELLKSVGLDPEIGKKHMYQLNENQIKQVIVAQALAVNPKYIIADEVSSQSNGQIKRTLYELMLKIKARLGIGLILVDNDIANLCNYTDRIGIMLYGRIVEVGLTEEMINSPMHPYTKRIIGLSNQRTSLNDFHLDEDLTDTSVPVGCPYAKKCKRSEVKCRLMEPELQLRSNDRSVACHNVEEQEHPAIETAATGFGMVV